MPEILPATPFQTQESPGCSSLYPRARAANPSNGTKYSQLQRHRIKRNVTNGLAEEAAALSFRGRRAHCG